jgi:acetyltransferase
MPDGPVRIAKLPGGRLLTVRRVRPADADQLAALYEGLSDDDRYRRFFSLYRPDRATIACWAADNEAGKLRLAAFVGSAAGDPELVGDALCVPLPDGDGEFALAVAPAWRGWLGAYLLDTLAEVATAMGMRSLHADILTENRRMLAVVQARGYAVLSHPDFNQVRVTTGTVPPTPDWPPSRDRPRILIEARGTRSSLHSQVAMAGFQTITCPGPGRRCPALAGRPCPLAAGADAIVFNLPADDAVGEALVAAHARLHPFVPLCVVDRPGVEPAAWPPGAYHVAAASLGDDLRSGPLALHPTGGTDARRTR